jgi:hypothetical protein
MKLRHLSRDIKLVASIGDPFERNRGMRGGATSYGLRRMLYGLRRMLMRAPQEFPNRQRLIAVVGHAVAATVPEFSRGVTQTLAIRRLKTFN